MSGPALMWHTFAGLVLTAIAACGRVGFDVAGDAARDGAPCGVGVPNVERKSTGSTGNAAGDYDIMVSKR